MTEDKDQKIKELEARVEQLEEQQQGSVSISRRQAMGAGALGIGGLLGGVGALGSSGTAKAETDGNAIYGIDQIGLDDDRVSTLYVDELNNLETTDHIEADSVSAENSVTVGGIEVTRGDYELQKDGTDEQGVVNFKTE